MKAGLKTIPLAVDNSDELKMVEREFGITGFAVIIKLFQCIAAKGYYTVWAQDEQLLFIDDYRLSSVGRNAVTEIVGCAIRRGIFDSSLYQKYNILTNRAIQETFLKANSRTTVVKMEKDYVMHEVCTFIENASEKGKFVNILWKNASNSDTKEKKGKERKGKESLAQARESESFTPPSLAEVKAYCGEKGLTVDANEFLDYFEATDWIDSRGQKVMSWKGKLLTWNKLGKQQPFKTNEIGMPDVTTVTKKSADELMMEFDSISADNI